MDYEQFESFHLRMVYVRKKAQVTQVNRRSHFARAVHSRHPFPPIGDAAYCQHAEGGPSHGHRQHAQKFGKDRECGSVDILADRQTDRQTYSALYFATAPAGEVNTQK